MGRATARRTPFDGAFRAIVAAQVGRGQIPTIGCPLALAVLDASAAAIGTPIGIDGLGARVTTHPAYHPEKLRPRS